MSLTEKSIKKLLNKYTMVVPEIQREYVWGNKSNQGVLEKFLTELDFALNNNKDTNIGFLYSYDAKNNEHYIIDGQQRFTTIILLLFYYAVQENRTEEFNELLKTSSPMMKFSYRVRPLTEQFLNYLFSEIKSIEDLKQIKDLSWYITEYDTDKTIKSIFDFYQFICNKKNSFENINYNSLLNRVKFYYFDVKQTSQGEELYITMNSRGEKLNDSEQIKPYILENIKDKEKRNEAAGKWDNWEEFFFKKLKKKLKSQSIEIDEKNIKSIDNAIENIIKICLELYGKRKITEASNENEKWEFDKINPAEDSKRINFDDVQKVYEKIEILLGKEAEDTIPEEIKNLKLLDFLFETTRSEKVLYCLETLIVALDMGYELSDKNILRFMRLINNALIQGVIKHVSLLKFLDKINEKQRENKPENIYEYIFKNQEICKDVFWNDNNKEEIYKIEAILEGGKQADSEGKISITEEEVEDAEKLPLFEPKIDLLYREVDEKNEIVISWKNFKTKYEKIKEITNASGEKAFNENNYVDFVTKFISAFSDVNQDKCFFSNNKDMWKEYLTTKNYLIPLDYALGLIEKYPQTDPIWKFLSEHVKEIIELNPNGRLRWYNNIRLALYPYYGGNDANMIIFDWHNFKRKEILNGIDEIKVASEKKIGDHFLGKDVRFSFNNKTYIWTWDNKLKDEGTNEILEDFNGKEKKDIEEILETL